MSKTEALALLALEKLTGNEMDNLELLTAKQIGYEVRQNGTYRQFERDNPLYELYAPGGESVYRHAYGSEREAWGGRPAYATSVDACLTLPIPGWLWDIHPPYEVILRETDNYYDTAVKVVNKPLPLAMLKAWWKIQPDDEKPPESNTPDK